MAWILSGIEQLSSLDPMLCGFLSSVFSKPIQLYLVVSMNHNVESQRTIMLCNAAYVDNFTDLFFLHPIVTCSPSDLSADPSPIA